MAPPKQTSFSGALELLKSGMRIRREGWNGKGMWLALVTASGWDLLGSMPPNTVVERAPWIGMKTADNKFVPWLASQTDILANDWEIAP
jgi:hypothetical protein